MLRSDARRGLERRIRTDRSNRRYRCENAGRRRLAASFPRTETADSDRNLRTTTSVLDMPAIETNSLPRGFLNELAELSAQSESSGAGSQWPVQVMQALAEAGILACGIPPEFGGQDVGSSMTETYIDLATADLVSCFILTQQNSAVARIAASDNVTMKARWLPLIASGEAFATVGISHLSTSRQHLDEPAVAVTETASGFRFSGTVPWATSATQADVVVVGGTLPSGMEVLVAMPTDSSGFEATDRAELLALTASETGQIVLNDVEVDRSALLAGPVEAVMKTGAGGTGSVTTSALAVGLSQRCVWQLAVEAERRDDLTESYDSLRSEFAAVKRDILLPADARPSAEELRTRANSLALRTSQALMTACKGAGFVKGHPAEKAVREAMFFLVWSCPRPVASAAMQEFACRPFCTA